MRLNVVSSHDHATLTAEEAAELVRGAETLAFGGFTTAGM